MKLDHVGVIVNDMDRALTTYRDYLGLEVVLDGTVPHPDIMQSELLDKVFGAEGATSRVVLLGSGDGFIIELQQPAVPKVKLTPPEHLSYGSSGFRELGLTVTDIDSWFARAVELGYKTTTESVWEYPGVMKSFLFFDHEGNLIQLVEDIRPVDA